MVSRMTVPFPVLEQVSREPAQGKPKQCMLLMKKGVEYMAYQIRLSTVHKSGPPMEAGVGRMSARCACSQRQRSAWTCSSSSSVAKDRFANGSLVSGQRRSLGWSSGGIVNLFTFIDEFSPRRELFRAIKSKNGV
jgi:hypothetical protein